MSINDIISQILIFINSNPPLVLALFVLSLIANLIQVGTSFRDRKKLKSEEVERHKLAEMVNSYEDVLKIAKETVQDKTKLSQLKDEIRESASEAMRLTQEISQIEKMAQRKLVSQAIEYNLGVLNRAYTEIKDLQAQYNNLGDLPNIAPESVKAIESQVELALRKPYEFPKEFVFRSALLVLFIMLLPWPVDTLLLPFLIRYFLLAFFDAVWLFQNTKVQKTVIKYHSLIIFFAVFGVWYSFFHAIGSVLIPVLNSMLVTQYNLAKYSDLNTLLISLPAIFDMLPFPMGLLTAFMDWRHIRDEARENSIKKIQALLEKNAV